MLEVRIARSVGSLQLDVDLSVSSGTVLVAGPNGAGKTTLLHLILGISRPDAGRILLDGRPLFDCRVDVPAERRCLGYVPQDSALFPHLDVLGNVAFGLGHLPRAERRDRAGAWLTKLGVSDLARRRTIAVPRAGLGRLLGRCHSDYLVRFDRSVLPLSATLETNRGHDQHRLCRLCKATQSR